MKTLKHFSSSSSCRWRRGLAPEEKPFRTDAPTKCAACEEWNAPHEPFRVFGNTYYVGVAGLSAVLIASDDGHILLDGGLPQSAPLIDANIRKLGFRTGDIRLIVNSHAHFDHAGGIAALQRASGARVAASESGARAIEEGTNPPDDPQFEPDSEVSRFPAAKDVKVVKDGETLRVGALAVTAHMTAGAYAGEHDLDLAFLRGFALPGRRLCRQPERRVVARVSFHRRRRSSQRRGGFPPQHRHRRGLALRHPAHGSSRLRGSGREAAPAPADHARRERPLRRSRSLSPLRRRCRPRGWTSEWPRRSARSRDKRPVSLGPSGSSGAARALLPFRSARSRLPDRLRSRRRERRTPVLGLAPGRDAASLRAPAECPCRQRAPGRVWKSGRKCGRLPASLCSKGLTSTGSTGRGGLPVPAVFRRSLREKEEPRRHAASTAASPRTPPREWEKLEAQLAALPAFSKPVKSLTRSWPAAPPTAPSTCRGASSCRPRSARRRASQGDVVIVGRPQPLRDLGARRPGRSSSPSRSGCSKTCRSTSSGLPPRARTRGRPAGGPRPPPPPRGRASTGETQTVVRFSP